MSNDRRCLVTLGVACASVCALACGGGAGAPPQAPAPGDDAPVARTASPIPAEASVLVLVVTDDWADFAGTIATFERRAGGRWEAARAARPVVVGRNGLGWGVGLHGVGAPAGRSGPEKREGDGRAPAGVFALGEAFGYAATPPSGARVPYRQSTPSWVCVDDGRSSHYNRVLDSSSVDSDWSSAERLLRDDPLYERLVLVDHNVAPPRPGYGSCIFVHVWRTPERGTDGCYATSLEDTESLLASVVPERSVLVALPRAELDALREPWGLP